jgi:hypothetical protein
MVLLTHRMTLEETLQSHVSSLLAHRLVVPYIDHVFRYGKNGWLSIFWSVGTLTFATRRRKSFIA